MKLLTDDIASFMNEGWPGDDWYMDHDSVTHPIDTDVVCDDSTGVTALYRPAVPGELVDAEPYKELYLVWQGQGDKDSKSWMGFFNKWKRSRNITTIVCQVKNEDVEEFKTMAQKMGVKVEC